MCCWRVWRECQERRVLSLNGDTIKNISDQGRTGTYAWILAVQAAGLSIDEDTT